MAWLAANIIKVLSLKIEHEGHVWKQTDINDPTPLSLNYKYSRIDCCSHNALLCKHPFPPSCCLCDKVYDKQEVFSFFCF